jgi:hypothetical protein
LILLVNLTYDDFEPVGRPKILPSDFFNASASFVRWEIKSRSISADSQKANASTFD